MENCKKNLYKLEDIPEQELDTVLQQFFAELRKKMVKSTNQTA